MLDLPKFQRAKFIKIVNLNEENFNIKIADLGFSKKLKNKEELTDTICGTLLYMAP